MPLRHPSCSVAVVVIALCAPLAAAQAPKNDPPRPGPHRIHGAMLGSWEHTVRDETTAEHDDAADTVEALVGTRQDFHIYQIDSDIDWEDFQDLVAEASLAGVQIYAAMDAPHLAHSASRWFDTDGDGAIGDTPPIDDCSSLGHGFDAWECQRQYIRHWINAWERAARELSLLSASYPDTLVGFAINDFMLYVESPAFPQCVDGKRLSIDEIRRIADACRHHPDSTLGFYPVVSFGAIGHFISPGVTLGTGYGVRISEDDEMVVRYHVPLLPDPTSAKLSFFHSTDTEDADYIRSIWVAKDGEPMAEVWSSALLEEDGPDVAYAEHILDLDTGHNVIELRLSAETLWTDGCGNSVTRGCGGTGDWWIVWNVRLEYSAPWAGGVARFEFPLSPTFHTTADPDDYCRQGTCDGPWFDLYTLLNNNDCRCSAFGDCTPFLPDNAIDGRLAKRLVAAPNDAYLIQDVIDGIIPYVSSTDLHGPADALDPGLHYARLLRETKADLGADLLIPFHTAFPEVDETTHDVIEADTDVLVHRVYLAAKHADASGVYRFPLGMYFMDPSDQRGLFQEVAGSSGYRIARWPTDQGILPGWYQRWVHNAPPGATLDLTVDVVDDRDASSNWGTFLKFVDGGGLASPWTADPFNDATGADTIPSDGTFLASSASDPVTFGLEAVSGSPVYLNTYFRAKDSAGNIVTDWLFESGVDDPHTIDIYDSLVELFHLIHGP